MVDSIKRRLDAIEKEQRALGSLIDALAGGVGGGAYLLNVVEDLSPELGGDLGMNGKGIDFPTTPNITDCLDEDDMASDSATMLATQQSIKKYVDDNLPDLTTHAALDVHASVALFPLSQGSDYLYAGTYNFAWEDLGATGTNIAWVDAETPFNGGAMIAQSFDGHLKVFRLLDDATAAEDPEVTHNITQATSGIIEFYFGISATTEVWQLRIRETATELVRFLISTKIQYLDGGWQDIQNLSANTFYLFKFQWYADNTWDLTIDETLKVNGQGMENNQVTGVNAYNMLCIGDSTESIYIDAWGHVGVDGYSEGDNAKKMYVVIK